MLGADELDQLYQATKAKMPENVTREQYAAIMAEADAARLLINGKIIHVQIDDQAKLLAKTLFRQLDTFLRPILDEATVFPGYYVALNRLSILATRFASVLAVVDNPHQPVIRYEQLAWAIGYLLQATCGILSAFDTNDMGVELADAEQTVVKLMQQMSQEEPWREKSFVSYGALKHRLLQRLPFRNHRDPRNEIQRCLDSMIEDEMLSSVDHRPVDERGNLIRKTGPKIIELRMNDHACWRL